VYFCPITYLLTFALSTCFKILSIITEKMSSINSYRDLLIWQKSMNLVTEIYKATSAFPREEIYGITSQIRRSSVSIPSNIAEGYGRSSTGDYKRFLHISLGSLYELQTQIEISNRLSYIDIDSYTKLGSASNELERMMNSLISKIK
jgi:four helix bundle protein